MEAKKKADSDAYIITPTTEKGEVILTKTPDSLMHFQWKNRTTNSIDPSDDLMVFPGDVKFSKVDTGKEGDRVFLLQYNNSSRRFFYWAQTKDATKDEENVKKINEYINNPASASNAQPSDGLDPQTLQMLQMLQGGAAGGGSSAGGGGSGGASSSPGGGVQMDDLQAILQQMGLPAQPPATPAPAPATPAPAPASTPAPAPAADDETTPAPAPAPEDSKDES